MCGERERSKIDSDSLLRSLEATSQALLPSSQTQVKETELLAQVMGISIL